MGAHAGHAMATSGGPGVLDVALVAWFAMTAMSTAYGLILAYPVNWWLVAAGLQYGMGTVHALGRGGQAVVGGPDRPDVPSGGQAAAADSSSHPADHARAGAATRHGMGGS